MPHRAGWYKNNMATGKDAAVVALETVGLKPGDRWRHFKGGEYEIVTCAIKEDTLEPLVIYRNLSTGSVWARTLLNWNEKVKRNGTLVGRFERLSA